MKKSLPILAFLIALTAPLAWAEALQSEPTRADVVVYGATPAGIAAAVAAVVLLSGALAVRRLAPGLALAVA